MKKVIIAIAAAVVGIAGAIVAIIFRRKAVENN